MKNTDGYDSVTEIPDDDSAGHALAVREDAGVALYRQSTSAADICRAIVLETAIAIQGRKYVRVEGWQAIAVAHGCVASSGDVERVDGGVRASAWLVDRATGREIARAEGFVGSDEPKWANAPEYAVRAMAQTRAISRVCRSAFAHVVVMMAAGLSTTPAEEVPDEGFQGEQHAARAPRKGASAPPATHDGHTAALATEKQARMLYAKCRDAGIEPTEFGKHFQVHRFSELPRERVEEAIEWIAAYGDHASPDAEPGLNDYLRVPF